jgi:hypothetical protein
MNDKDLELWEEEMEAHLDNTDLAPVRVHVTVPCPCECNRGSFCGGCGHAGCGRR